MRYYEFVFEGYTEVQRYFEASASSNEVKTVISKFRELVNRNQVQGNERNIDWWKKQGWDRFKEFVSTKQSEPTKTEIKRKKLVGNSITLHDNDKWLIVVPLDKEASCYYGKNSDWCTTKNDQPYFEKYFYQNGVTLIYCLSKTEDKRWAIAGHEQVRQIEIFDQYDTSLSSETFTAQTGLDAVELTNQALKYKEIPQIREQYNSDLYHLQFLLEQFDYNHRDEEIEDLLVHTKSARYCRDYIRNIANNLGPSEFPPAIVLAAMTKYDRILPLIKNPSFNIQLAAVKKNYGDIQYINNPHEKLQLIAIEQQPYAISYIKNPTKKAQLLAFYTMATDFDREQLEFKIKNLCPELFWELHKEKLIQYENVIYEILKKSMPTIDDKTIIAVENAIIKNLKDFVELVKADPDPSIETREVANQFTTVINIWNKTVASLPNQKNK
jgi:hypothetical protein